MEGEVQSGKGKRGQQDRKREGTRGTARGKLTSRDKGRESRLERSVTKRMRPKEKSKLSANLNRTLDEEDSLSLSLILSVCSISCCNSLVLACNWIWGKATERVCLADPLSVRSCASAA